MKPPYGTCVIYVSPITQGIIISWGSVDPRDRVCDRDGDAEVQRIPWNIESADEGFLGWSKTITLCRGRAARDLPFLHRLCNAQIAPNVRERGTCERSEGGSSIFIMSIMCGFIACSPAASEFLRGLTLDDAGYAYPSEPGRKEY